MLTKSLWSPQTQSEKIWPSWPISCKNTVKMYWLSSKASRPAPREHHEQRQGNLPRQVEAGGLFSGAERKKILPCYQTTPCLYIYSKAQSANDTAVCLVQPTPLLAGSLMSQSHQSTAKTYTSRPPFFEAAFGDTA